MKQVKRGYSEYFITPFLASVFALTIICFLIEIETFSKGLIIVLIGASIFSILFGSLLIITNKYVRPKIQKYFLGHKNIKSLTTKGLKYNDLMKGYFGTYRDYDVQVLCHYEKLNLLTTEYVINIVFKKIAIDKSILNLVRDRFENTKITEVFIQRLFQFKLKPPSKEQLDTSIDLLIDFLKEEKIDPIRVDEIEKEINNNVA